MFARYQKPENPIARHKSAEKKSIKLHLFMATGTTSNICQATPNNLPYVSHQGAAKQKLHSSIKQTKDALKLEGAEFLALTPQTHLTYETLCQMSHKGILRWFVTPYRATQKVGMRIKEYDISCYYSI